MEINCTHCNRYLFKQAGSVVIEGLICPGCKAKHNFKIISADQSQDFKYKFVNPALPPKKKEIEVS